MAAALARQLASRELESPPIRLVLLLCSVVSLFVTLGIPLPLSFFLKKVSNSSIFVLPLDEELKRGNVKFSYRTVIRVLAVKKEG